MADLGPYLVRGAFQVLTIAVGVYAGLVLFEHFSSGSSNGGASTALAVS